MHLLDVNNLCQALNLNGGSALCKQRETKSVFQMNCKRYRNSYMYVLKTKKENMKEKEIKKDPPMRRAFK